MGLVIKGEGWVWFNIACSLHLQLLLHQYISSNVILIDDDFDATLVGTRDSNDSSFVNGDLGEFGYVAPGYSSTLVASLKGDVYSFGVVLLELVTGQKPLEVNDVEEGFKGNLVDWIKQCGTDLVTDKVPSTETLYNLNATIVGLVVSSEASEIFGQNSIGATHNTDI